MWSTEPTSEDEKLFSRDIYTSLLFYFRELIQQYNEGYRYLTRV